MWRLFTSRSRQSAKPMPTDADAWPEGEESDEQQEAIWRKLKRAVKGVDVEARQLIWTGGTRLSISEAAGLLHQSWPKLPVELIDEHITEWLECEYEPKGLRKTQIEDFDGDLAMWLEEHEESREG